MASYDWRRALPARLYFLTCQGFVGIFLHVASRMPGAPPPPPATTEDCSVDEPLDGERGERATSQAEKNYLSAARTMAPSTMAPSPPHLFPPAREKRRNLSRCHLISADIVISGGGGEVPGLGPR